MTSETLHFPNWRFGRRTVSAEESEQPRYRIPARMILLCILTSIQGRTRNIRSDTSKMVGMMAVEPVVSGSENLPLSGPFVVLPNHYERPDGAWVGWGAVVITDSLGKTLEGTCPIRWVMTSTWQDCYLGPRRVNPNYLRWVLRRLAHLYGIILVPAEEFDITGRSTALREVFHALDHSEGQIVAFHPEAGGFESLIRPPKGMGRVLTAIDRKGIRMIPTGVFEESGRFNIRFGTPITPGSLRGLTDEQSALRVMKHIAALIPERMYGELTSEFEATAEEVAVVPAS